MNDYEAKLILVLAECNMNVTQTSKKVMFARTTVIYQLEQIRKKTNLDPNNFYDLGELVTIAQHIIEYGYDFSE